MQQQRAVRATVREDREGAAGDEEPATKSRASSLPTVKDEKPGRRCERNGPQGVESSTVNRQQSPENRGPARSPRLLRASARSRGVTSGQRSRNTEWVGRRPRLRLAGGELSRAVRREAVAGPAGGIPEQRYEGSAMYYSAGAAAGLNTLIVTHGVSDRRSPRRLCLVVLDELAQVVVSDPVLVPNLHSP